MNATMSLEKIKHYPVMLNQILSIISPQRGGTFIDCTFGGGGYSEAILKFSKTKVIALDRDKLCKNRADILMEQFPGRLNFFREKFSNLNKVIQKKINPQAIIFDLGMSSFQLLDKERGFSFDSENFLDMEMGINDRSAYDVINFSDKKTLSAIIKILGEEKDAKIIANKIEKYRNTKKIKTPKELAYIISEAKKKYNNYKKNPATKTFQALRIYVNQELTELMLGLTEAAKLLSKGGILIVVSFHSLEDRIVKNFLHLYSNLRKNPSRYLPLKKNEFNLFELTCKKALSPSKEELIENISSRSAKLRYAIRNGNSFVQTDELKRNFSKYFELEGMQI